ncbi:MAG: AgmX/PglI C-terminal domain-containing protein [Deltaproteobacteria bacterium]|nr:AgmX/PglI C-terminal domain-containing protein [Deltaproteobacteria bacterium]
MLCTRCQAQLPDDARFCGMCGLKFDAPGVVSANQEFGIPQTGAKPIQYFQETTGKTDAARSEQLREVAEKAMASTPPPGQPAASEPAPADATAARPSFQFKAEDLARALSRAAKQESKPAPDVEPADLDAYYKAGEAAGITRTTLEESLHKVSVKRVETRPGMLAEGDAPLTTELQSIEPPGKKIAIIGGAVVGLLVVVGIGYSVLGGGGPPEVPAAAPATGDTAAAAAPPTGDKPAQATPPAAGDKPRRKAGILDEKAIRPALEGVAVKARACHEVARKTHPKVAGVVKFDVEIEEDGTFSKLDVKQDTLGDPRMLECVKNEVRNYPWPRPKGGFFAMEFPLGFEVAEAKAGGKGKKKR